MLVEWLPLPIKTDQSLQPHDSRLALVSPTVLPHQTTGLPKTSQLQTNRLPALPGPAQQHPSPSSLKRRSVLARHHHETHPSVIPPSDHPRAHAPPSVPELSHGPTP